MSGFIQPHGQFAVYSLFTWHDAHDSFIRPLVYALKGGVIREVWKDLATEFLFLRTQGRFDDDAIIVLPPRKKREDHAFFWAKSLSEASGIEVNDCLESVGPLAKQKNLSLEARQNREFALKRPCDTSKRIIFVDDTITSGSTARAAFEALDEPGRFEIWTLVAKPRFGTQ